MITVPSEISARFDDFIKKRFVPSVHHNYYKKWLRYYLDYCAKYGLSHVASKNMTRFLGKLREKKQTAAQVKQAGHAVSLFLDLMQSPRITPDSTLGTAESGMKETQETPALRSLPYSVARSSRQPAPNSILSAWARAVAALVSVIKTRHYSPKTLRHRGRLSSSILS